MLSSAIPAKFPIPFAANAAGGYIRPIPVDSQIGVQAGAASLNDGFVPVNFQPVASGGVPPFGQDANGILKMITLWNQWQGAGGPVFYDAGFASTIGGYPKQALLASSTTAGVYWSNLAENNTTNPDTGGANWQRLVGPQSVTNAMLAQAPALTVKGNLLGAAGAIQDWSMSALFAALISPNSITNAMVQQAPAQTIRGNLIGGPSNVQDWTMAQLFGTLIGGGSITNPYLGVMAPATLKGNIAPGVSAPQDISIATLLSIMGAAGGFDFSQMGGNPGTIRLGPFRATWGGGGSSTGNSDHIPFGTNFAGQPFFISAWEGSPGGSWGSGGVTAVSAQPFTGDSTQFGLFTLKWTGSSWVPMGGIGYAFLAFGAA